MSQSIDDLLTLEKLDLNLYRSRYHRENFRKTLFGGQVLGQALTAVSQTVEDLLPTSLHAYFLRPGSSESAVIYDVENVRDGNSISTRRVVARQDGRPIFNMSASFHRPEQGFEHQEEHMTGVPSPEEIISMRGIPSGDKHIANSVKAGKQDIASPFLLLPVDETLLTSNDTRAPRAQFWLKANQKLSDSKQIQHSALAFASDLGLLATSLLPHSSNLFDSEIFAASIDHAMWFHTSDFRTDDWLLYETTSPWAGNARGFCRGSLFRRDGKLIASTTQEGLIRPSDALAKKL